MLNDCISQCQDGVFHTDPVFRTCWVTVFHSVRTESFKLILFSGHVEWLFHIVRTESFTLIRFSGHAEWLYFTVSAQSLSCWSCVPGPGVQVPAVYGLDSTDPSQWSHNVLQPAIRILSAISTVSLSVCLFAFLSVHLSVSLVSTHPTQWLDSMLQPAFCIMSALAQAVCLFSVCFLSYWLAGQIRILAVYYYV